MNFKELERLLEIYLAVSSRGSDLKKSVLEAKSILPHFPVRESVGNDILDREIVKNDFSKLEISEKNLIEMISKNSEFSSLEEISRAVKIAQALNEGKIALAAKMVEKVEEKKFLKKDKYEEIGGYFLEKLMPNTAWVLENPFGIKTDLYHPAGWYGVFFYLKNIPSLIFFVGFDSQNSEFSLFHVNSENSLFTEKKWDIRISHFSPQLFVSVLRRTHKKRRKLENFDKALDASAQNFAKIVKREGGEKDLA